MQGGGTPLFIASQNGHLEVVHLLSYAGAAGDIAMQGGAATLFIAPQGGQLEAAVSWLSDVRADKDIAMQGGATPLSIASRNGRLEVVCLLFRGRQWHRNAGLCHPLVPRIPEWTNHLEMSTRSLTQGPTRTSQCRAVPPPCPLHLWVDTSRWSVCFLT